VTKQGVASVLDDDVGMGFEQRHHFVFGTDSFSLKNPTFGLADHLSGQVGKMSDLEAKCHGQWVTGPAGVDRNDSMVGVSDHFAAGLEQIHIWGLALVFAFGVHHRQHPAFGHTSMVMETRNVDPKVLSTSINQSSQHPHTIPQQVGVSGMMDVGFNARAIDTDLATLFNAFLLRMSQKIGIDPFPGGVRYGFDVFIQRGSFVSLVCNSDPAEPTQGLRIDDVKGEIFIRESEKNIHNSTTQHLVGTHAVSPRSIGHHLSLVQILKNAIADDRVGIDNVTDAVSSFAWV